MSELLSRIGRLQHARRYKIIASIVVTLLVVGVIGALWVAANSADAEAGRAARMSETPTGIIAQGPIGAVSGAYDTLLAQLTTGEGIATVSIGGAFVLAGLIGVIWLGLSLTYVAALAVGWAVAWPLMVLDGTRDFGLMLFGAVPLVLALLTLLSLARILLSAPTPTFAIAKNVLSEAVRMKISLVFIVILLLLLAVTPTVLTEDQALRYRVQQWLTYGLGLPFGVLALLTVFFSTASVAFEQRDKIIWQTMTKPVRPHEYLVGKWMGVMTLNLILLTVSASGVFLFTEYLRYQPAENERAYMVDLQGNPTRTGSDYLPSDDRRILENQVLAARVGVEPILYELSDESLDFYLDVAIATDDDLDNPDRPRVRQEMRAGHLENINAIVERRLESLRQQADYFEAGEAGIEAQRDKIESKVREDVAIAARSVSPGTFRVFFFDLRDQWARFERLYERGITMIEDEVQRRVKAGELDEDNSAQMQNAFLDAQLTLQREGRLPEMPQLTLRYTVDAGTNDPTAIYDLFFAINGEPYPPNPGPIEAQGLRRVGLGVATSFDFPIRLLDRPKDELDGVLELQIASPTINPRTITFAEGNIEVFYDAGGYQLNFLRTIAIMWIKLGFIAAVGIALASFLSFPVAALVTLAVLFAAEGADYLTESLQSYISKDAKGNIYWWRIPIRLISFVVAWMFETYGSLKPAEGIADGKLMQWSTLARAALWIGLWSVGMLAVGWAAFRRKELAIYSGH